MTGVLRVSCVDFTSTRTKLAHNLLILQFEEAAEAMMNLLGGVFFHFFRYVGIDVFGCFGIFMADFVHNGVEIHAGLRHHRNMRVSQNMRALHFEEAGFFA